MKKQMTNVIKSFIYPIEWHDKLERIAEKYGGISIMAVIRIAVKDLIEKELNTK